MYTKFHNFLRFLWLIFMIPLHNILCRIYSCMPYLDFKGNYLNHRRRKKFIYTKCMESCPHVWLFWLLSSGNQQILKSYNFLTSGPTLFRFSWIVSILLTLRQTQLELRVFGFVLKDRPVHGLSFSTLHLFGGGGGGDTLTLELGRVPLVAQILDPIH